MAMTNEELHKLSQVMMSKYDIQIVNLVTMFSFYRNLSIGQPDLLIFQHAALLGTCIGAYMREAGIDPAQFQNALLDLNRVNSTAMILNSLPD